MVKVVRRDTRFNSKLVRLKDHDSVAKVVKEPVFQFQTGAIKRWNCRLGGCSAKSSFQFQTGAIKRVGTDILYHQDYSFQFQTGAIKSIIM